MSTGIGMVSQGEFMSSKSLVEAARIVLSAAPHGLSEEMLVHVLLLDDRPFVGLGAHVYGARSKSKKALGNKGLAALRRTKGMSKRDGRWFYDGPPPSGDKVADGEAVVRDTPSSPGIRCCKGCGCILRSSNPEEWCDPCGVPEVPEPVLQPVVRKQRPKRIADRSREDVIEELMDWSLEHGRPPTSHDWQVARRPGETRSSRHFVIKQFGTWNAAMEAAGFTSRPREKGTAEWSAVMDLLPATAREVGVATGRRRRASFDRLARMEKSGWVYRERLPSKGEFVPGRDLFRWHPMPQGMEAAA